MMQRVLESVFARWGQFVAMLVLPLVIALGIAQAQPRQYQGSATLWALQSFTGGSTSAQDPASTPAATQAAAISEILQTKSFALAIGKAADLASTYSPSARSNPVALNDAIFSDISAHVQATTSGANLVTITYDNRSPAVAQRVVQAVVNQYDLSAAQLASSNTKQLLLLSQQELQQVQATATQANAAETTYLINHPGATAATDPQFKALQDDATNALYAVSAIQRIIDQLNAQASAVGTGSNALFSVVDAPSVGSQPVSRSKTLLTGGIIGLAIGLLACIIYIAILLRRDRSIYSVSDLQRVTKAPVLLQIPLMPPVALAPSANQLGGGERLLLNGSAPERWQ